MAWPTIPIVAVLFLLNRHVSAVPSCRFIPGDEGWPSQSDWDRLNRTVRGRLIATVPLASVCHTPTYSETACDSLKQQWDLSPTHVLNPGSIMDPYFQNQSCDPFTDSSVPCLLGNLPPYFVNVSSAQDVLAGITFAKEKNIRLVVQNTGHDLLGKSAGQGALGLWEHPLKSTEIIQSYDSSSYRGPAMRIGAGVLAGEALAAAHKHGFRVVGGSAASVGLAGGYSQGGGHSLLSSAHGLGADNVLEWEVVTPAGQHLTASPAENQDLYWALCGGGGGTYGVVLSMTLILHPDGPVGGAHLAFQAADVGYDNYWKAINFFHASLPAIVDSGGAILYQFDNESFTTISVAAPGQDEAQVAELLRPLIKGLKELKMPHTFAPSFSSDFYTHFSAVLGPLPYGVFPVSYMSSSRLIPRSAVVDRPGDVSAALQTAVKSGSFTLGCLALNANRTQHPDNAVLPAWREALLQCIPHKAWDWTRPRSEMEALRREMTEVLIPALVAATPGSGTYLNEADFRQPNWQYEFYGANYARLLEIKKKYDPDALLYAATAVGSDAWVTDGEGRLCRSEKAGHSDKGSWEHVREL